jgi:hypothetical protein
MAFTLKNMFNSIPDASGWVRGGVVDITAGDGINIDNSNPEYPVISSYGEGGGYTPGNGINISDGVISAYVDGSTITTDASSHALTLTN